jgi:hypothetical protein
VWISFSRHSPNWRVVTRQVRKQLAKYIEIVSERGKTLAKLANGLIFLLANPEFYSHLTNWRVADGCPPAILFYYLFMSSFTFHHLSRCEHKNEVLMDSIHGLLGYQSSQPAKSLKQHAHRFSAPY